eukprot:GFUD01063591.1.p1 GENE.GFUD01063591.1~~GFUD01063591.1.p1  ORF type:complete len:238 (+),score=45.37 GFUD01063591.1:40-714(+)
MMNGVVDHFLIKEHCAIYFWRESFFSQHLPNNSWFTVDFENEDELETDAVLWKCKTIPYQITRNFNTVMALASAKVIAELSWPKKLIYFENNEQLSYKAIIKYKWAGMTVEFEEIEGFTNQQRLAYCDWASIGFSEVAHIIAEVHQTGPKKLEEMALKAVLLCHISSGSTDFLPLDYLPTAMNKKAANGMYNLEGKTPDNISDEGKEMFERIRRVFTSKNNNSG